MFTIVYFEKSTEIGARVLVGRGSRDIKRLRTRTASNENTNRNVQSHIQIDCLSHLFHDRVDLIGGEQAHFVDDGQCVQEGTTTGCVFD